MEIKFKWLHLKQVTNKFRELEKNCKNISPMLKSVGEELLQTTQERFDQSKAPNAKKWQALKKSTIQQKIKKKKSRKPLIRDRYLRDYIRYQTSPKELSLGSVLDYAAVHQFGSKKKKIPARPFLGISKNDEKIIYSIIKKHLNIK